MLQQNHMMCPHKQMQMPHKNQPAAPPPAWTICHECNASLLCNVGVFFLADAMVKHSGKRVKRKNSERSTDFRDRVGNTWVGAAAGGCCWCTRSSAGTTYLLHSLCRGQWSNAIDSMSLISIALYPSHSRRNTAKKGSQPTLVRHHTNQLKLTSHTPFDCNHSHYHCHHCCLT